ncbi:MAG: sensor histidine kinase [Alphaproteobacteria bacterium]|nr:sensor histidine kinase [Alphaproteobacteria bacterium]
MKPAAIIPDRPLTEAEIIGQEYSEFAYIVSHDLSAPLRHVKEFTRLLIDLRPDTDNAEEKKYRGYLEESLERLDRMQESLLAFSRLNTVQGINKPVDCNRLMEQVVAGLEPAIARHNATVACGLLPIVTGDPRQLQSLFHHLIDNALKFHRGTGKRTVFVTAREDGEFFLFEVQDNGIGVASAYHEEIFRMFRRLNPSEYPGSGAGLTLARKIIQRHGGWMSLKSAEDQGTSVCFSIPKNSESSPEEPRFPSIQKRPD